MKKLLALALIAGVFSGLYGLKLGLGVAYEDVLEDSRYLCIKGDARVPILPIVDVRANLLQVALPDGGKAIHFGTFVDSDLMVKFPMPAAFQPYLVLGLWFAKGLEDAPMDYTTLALKAGLGGEMGFGGMNGYLEFGLHNFTWNPDADPATDQMLYGQLGLVFPLEM